MHHFKKQNVWCSQFPLLVETEICLHWVFCREFNFAQLFVWSNFRYSQKYRYYQYFIWKYRYVSIPNFFDTLTPLELTHRHMCRTTWKLNCSFCIKLLGIFFFVNHVLVIVYFYEWFWNILLRVSWEHSCRKIVFCLYILNNVRKKITSALHFLFHC